MSWHYLRAQEEESLQDICSGGELCVPLKSKITHAEFYCNGKLMDSYLASLSGTTFAHSMESLGEERSMSSQVDSHAKICQQQEKAKGLTESDQDSGEKWQGSFAKYNPDTHSLRTHQCLLFEDSTEFCAILPKWGLMRNGECWEQQTLAHLTKETESGLWLTPTVMDSLPIRNPEALERQYQKNRKGRTTHATLREQVAYPPPKEMFPTPCATDYKGSGQTGQLRDRLDYAVERGATKSKTYIWPTPVSDDTSHRKNKYAQGGTALSTKAGGTLNPNWVEWLMGWPIGFTDLQPLEMDKSPCVQQPLGDS